MEFAQNVMKPPAKNAILKELTNALIARKDTSLLTERNVYLNALLELTHTKMLNAFLAEETVLLVPDPSSVKLALKDSSLILRNNAQMDALMDKLNLTINVLLV